MIPSSISELPTSHILGTPLTLCSRDQLLQSVEYTINDNGKQLILSGNIYSFNLAYENEWLQNFFKQADIVRLDGAGVSLGAKILGYQPPSRMTWADFAWQLADFC